MLRTRLVLPALLLPLASALVATPAHAVGTECGSPHAQTNDWHVFWSKKVRETTAVCRTPLSHGPAFTYVRTPKVSYPSAWPIPSAEKVSTTTGMHLYSSKQGEDGHAVQFVWRWSAKSCTVVCTSWDFSVTVNATNGTRLCMVGGSCDSWKHWG